MAQGLAMESAEPPAGGRDFAHQRSGECITAYSASNYCGSLSNQMRLGTGDLQYTAMHWDNICIAQQDLTLMLTQAACYKRMIS